YHKIWEPLPGQPIQLTETIEPEIIRLHREFPGKLAAVYFDPMQMLAIMENCRKAGVKMIEYQQTTRRVESDTLFRDMVIGKNIGHYGPPEVKAHVMNAAVQLDGERGIRIIKQDTKL